MPKTKKQLTPEEIEKGFYNLPLSEKIRLFKNLKQELDQETANLAEQLKNYKEIENGQ